MHAVLKVLDWLARMLLVIAGIALVFMMGVTLFDVIVRNLGRWIDAVQEISYTGTIELVRYSFLLAMAGAMPWGVEKSQVVVELFTQNLPEAWRARVDAFFMVGFGVLGVLIAYGLFNSGMQAIGSGETTSDLRIPMAPIEFGASFCMALMALRAFLVGIIGLRTGEPHVV